MGLGTYNDQALSQQDKAKIDSLSQQWFEQKAVGADQSVLDSIHNQAEAIRAQYNYSGGVDGSDYIYLKTDTPSKSSILSATPKNADIEYLYEMQLNKALKDLQIEYEQNKINLEATKAKIPAAYQLARNQTAAASEINRAAFNEQAAAYGINSGTGSQANLAMYNQLVGNMSAISTQEADKLSDIETEQLKMDANYINAKKQSSAAIGLAKAQALYSEAVRVDESRITQSQAQAAADSNYWAAINSYNQQAFENKLSLAAQGAAYGNFSGYKGILPDELIEWMYKVWAAQNPLLAASVKK